MMLEKKRCDNCKHRLKRHDDKPCRYCIGKKDYPYFEGSKKPKFGEWIPCSERLPEDGQKVLIQYVDSKDKNNIAMAVGWMEGHLVYRDKRHFVCWDDRVDLFYDAVAWMPLPDPFKESED